jgi:hypothetical protein
VDSRLSQGGAVFTYVTGRASICSSKLLLCLTASLAGVDKERTKAGKVNSNAMWVVLVSTLDPLLSATAPQGDLVGPTGRERYD